MLLLYQPDFLHTDTLIRPQPPISYYMTSLYKSYDLFYSKD